MDIACDLTGVTPGQLERHGAVSAALVAARRETRRDGDRFTITFGEDVSLALVAEFVEFERRCCTFLEFDICGRGASLCLELGGPEGAAPLIEELFPLVSA